MTILLTGGTGKSATPLAKLLLNANIPVILATRSGSVPAPFRGIRFDWLDASTYQIPFEADSSIDRIYLVAPPVLDMFLPMKAFIDFAITKGVKRFVLMSAALLEAGDLAMGKVHEYLLSRDVEYCALRPSWFFGPSCVCLCSELPCSPIKLPDNLLLDYSDHIRTKDQIINAAGSGSIGWISTDDIADVAFKALTDEVIDHTNPVMVGPESLTYAQVGRILVLMPHDKLNRI